jgi:ankyrin repeat protein
MGPHRVGPQSQWGPIGGPICSIDAKDEDGRTPLSIAAERGHEAVV